MDKKRHHFSFINSCAKFHLFANILWVLAACAVSAQMTNDEIQLQAYMALVKADGAKDEGQIKTAVVNYQNALTSYKELKAQAPDFKPEIIDYRISYCANQIEDLGDLKGTVTTQEASAPANNMAFKEQTLHLQRKIADLEERLEAALSAPEKQGRKEARLTEEVEQLRNEQKTLKQNLKDASRNVEAAKTEALKNLNNRLYEADLEHKKAQEQIASLQNELASAQGNVQNQQGAQKALAKAEQQIRELQKKLSTLEDIAQKNSTTQQANNDALFKIATLEDEIEGLKAAAEARGKEVTATLDAKAQQEIERLRNEAALKVETLTAVENQSKKEILLLKDQITQLNTAMRELETDSTRNIELEASLDRAVEKIKMLEEERTVMESALNIAQNSKSAGTNKIQELEAQKKLAEKNAEQTRSRIEILERQTAETRETNRQLQQELLQLKAQKGHNEDSKHQLEAQLAEYKNALDQTEQQLTDQQSRLRKQQVEKDVLAKQLNALENKQNFEGNAQIKKLNEQIAAINEKYKRVTDQVSYLEKEADLSKEQAEQLVDQKLNAEKQALKLEQKINKLEGKITELTQSGQQSNAELSLLKASSESAEEKAKVGEKQAAALQNKISLLTQGLEKAKITNAQLGESLQQSRSEKEGLDDELTDLRKELQNVSKQASKEASEKLALSEKALREESALKVNQAQKLAQEAIVAAKNEAATQLRAEKQKLADQTTKANTSASALKQLQEKLESVLAEKAQADIKSSKLALGLNKAFEANNKLQSAVNALKTENHVIPTLQKDLEETTREKESFQSQYEELAARVDESEAKEKFMRLNAEETISQLETLEIQHNKTLGQLNSLRDQNVSYQKEAKASRQESEAIKKAMDALNTESVLPMKEKIKSLEAEKTQLSRMIKETKELAESHQRSATALIQDKEKALRNTKLSVEANKRLIKKLEAQLEDQAVTLATADTLQQAHDQRQTQLEQAMTQITEYKNLSTELQTQVDETSRALRNQNELLAQIDEMDATLIRVREEAAMVPGLANAQRLAEATLVTQGEQIENLQAQIIDKDTQLANYSELPLQIDTLNAAKEEALTLVQAKDLKIEELEALTTELQSTSNAANKETAYLNLKLSDARNEIQKLSRQQLDLIRQIRTLLGEPLEPKKK